MPPLTNHGWVGDEGFPVEKERYVLFVAAGSATSATPWLCAAWLALDTNQSLAVVRAFPAPSEAGYFFEPAAPEERQMVAAYPDTPVDKDPIYGAPNLRALYARASPGFSGPCTLPLLLDRKAKRVVSNDPAAIAEMLATRFTGVMMYSLESCDLAPPEVRVEVRSEASRWGERILAKAMACEASSDQSEFSRLEGEILEAIEELDKRLKKQKWILGKRFTLVDLVVWPMLLQYELVWRGAIGLQRKSLRAHFPHVWSFVQEVFVLPGIRRATDIEGCLLHAHLGNRSRGLTVPSLPEGFREELVKVPHRKNTLLARVLREAQHGMWVVPVIIGFFIGSEMGHKSMEHKLRREGRLIELPSEEGQEDGGEAGKGSETKPKKDPP